MAPVLTARHLLELWERGRLLSPLQRSLDLLEAAYPELSSAQLREMPVGQRDRRLLAVREALFGPHLSCLTTCPECSERLELALDTSELGAAPLLAETSGTYTLESGEWQVRFRLPNSGDLARVADLADVGRARQILFELCMQEASRGGAPVSANELPEGVIGTIADRMAELDPQADMQIALTCPACSEQWSSAFDISSYLWIEINAWALRMLHEIHRLASAYGWREADILALNPMRRQFYLELIG